MILKQREIFKNNFIIMKIFHELNSQKSIFCELFFFHQIPLFIE